MNLTVRITLAVGACGLVLSGVGGWLLLRREERDLLSVAQSETLLLGRSLQTAFENALRDRQIEDVTETLGALANVDRRVAIFVYDERAGLVGSSSGARPSQASLRASTIASRQEAPVVEFVPPVSPETLRVALRLREESPSRASAIVLEKPLSDLQRDLRTTRRTILTMAASLVAAVASLTWLLSRRYVGRPLDDLVADMRRVRSGDFHVAQRAATVDEVGAAQAEFERLVEDLEAARQRADRETEARRRIERGLQDADKLITLGQLSAVMAHEIGSPLQVLEGRARALRKHASDPEAASRTADLMVEQTERITRIVGQMLALTRRRPSALASIDAAASVSSVVSLLEFEARRKRVSLRMEKSGRTDAWSDADQLQQVVLNLVRNALDASPSGSAVYVRLGGDDRELSLEVQDSGPGVAPEHRPHLFEPFFTTKGEEGGHGLGLSVVKSIVQAHRGHVTFVEGTATGCTVRVVLPRGPEGGLQ